MKNDDNDDGSKERYERYHLTFGSDGGNVG